MQVCRNNSIKYFIQNEIILFLSYTRIIKTMKNTDPLFQLTNHNVLIRTWQSAGRITTSKLIWICQFSKVPFTIPKVLELFSSLAIGIQSTNQWFVGIMASSYYASAQLKICAPGHQLIAIILSESSPFQVSEMYVFFFVIVIKFDVMQKLTIQWRTSMVWC